MFPSKGSKMRSLLMLLSKIGIFITKSVLNPSNMVYGLLIENELFHLKRLTNEEKFYEIYKVVRLHYLNAYTKF